eukprot:Clim_evm55s108 gene=Clim_evmTU55s108
MEEQPLAGPSVWDPSFVTALALPAAVSEDHDFSMLTLPASDGDGLGLDSMSVNPLIATGLFAWGHGTLVWRQTYHGGEAHEFKVEHINREGRQTELVRQVMQGRALELGVFTVCPEENLAYVYICTTLGIHRVAVKHTPAHGVSATVNTELHTSRVPEDSKVIYTPLDGREMAMALVIDSTNVMLAVYDDSLTLRAAAKMGWRNQGMFSFLSRPAPLVSAVVLPFHHDGPDLLHVLVTNEDGQAQIWALDRNQGLRDIGHKSLDMRHSLNPMSHARTVNGLKVESMFAIATAGDVLLFVSTVLKESNNSPDCPYEIFTVNITPTILDEDTSNQVHSNGNGTEDESLLDALKVSSAASSITVQSAYESYGETYSYILVKAADDAITTCWTIDHEECVVVDTIEVPEALLANDNPVLGLGTLYGWETDPVFISGHAMCLVTGSQSLVNRYTPDVDGHEWAWELLGLVAGSLWDSTDGEDDAEATEESVMQSLLQDLRSNVLQNLRGVVKDMIVQVGSGHHGPPNLIRELILLLQDGSSATEMQQGLRAILQINGSSSDNTLKVNKFDINSLTDMSNFTLYEAITAMELQKEVHRRWQLSLAMFVAASLVVEYGVEAGMDRAELQKAFSGDFMHEIADHFRRSYGLAMVFDDNVHAQTLALQLLYIHSCDPNAEGFTLELATNMALTTLYQELFICGGGHIIYVTMDDASRCRDVLSVFNDGTAVYSFLGAEVVARHPHALPQRYAIVEALAAALDHFGSEASELVVSACPNLTLFDPLRQGLLAYCLHLLKVADHICYVERRANIAVEIGRLCLSVVEFSLRKYGSEERTSTALLPYDDALRCDSAARGHLIQYFFDAGNETDSIAYEEAFQTIIGYREHEGRKIMLMRMLELMHGRGCLNMLLAFPLAGLSGDLRDGIYERIDIAFRLSATSADGTGGVPLLAFYPQSQFLYSLYVKRNDHMGAATIKYEMASLLRELILRAPGLSQEQRVQCLRGAVDSYRSCLNSLALFDDDSDELVLIAARRAINSQGVPEGSILCQVRYRDVLAEAEIMYAKEILLEGAIDEGILRTENAEALIPLLISKESRAFLAAKRLAIHSRSEQAMVLVMKGLAQGLIDSSRVDTDEYQLVTQQFLMRNRVPASVGGQASRAYWYLIRQYSTGRDVKSELPSVKPALTVLEHLLQHNCADSLVRWFWDLCLAEGGSQTIRAFLQYNYIASAARAFLLMAQAVEEELVEGQAVPMPLLDEIVAKIDIVLQDPNVSASTRETLHNRKAALTA